MNMKHIYRQMNVCGTDLQIGDYIGGRCIDYLFVRHLGTLAVNYWVFIWRSMN